MECRFSKGFESFFVDPARRQFFTVLLTLTSSASSKWCWPTHRCFEDLCCGAWIARLFGKVNFRESRTNVSRKVVQKSVVVGLSFHADDCREGPNCQALFLHLKHLLIFACRILLSEIIHTPFLTHFPMMSLVRNLLHERLRMHIQWIVNIGQSAVRRLAVEGLILLWQRWYRRDVGITG